MSYDSFSFWSIIIRALSFSKERRLYLHNNLETSEIKLMGFLLHFIYITLFYVCRLSNISIRDVLGDSSYQMYFHYFCRFPINFPLIFKREIVFSVAEMWGFVEFNTCMIPCTLLMKKLNLFRLSSYTGMESVKAFISVTVTISSF